MRTMQPPELNVYLKGKKPKDKSAWACFTEGCLSGRSLFQVIQNQNLENDKLITQNSNDTKCQCYTFDENYFISHTQVTDC